MAPVVVSCFASKPTLRVFVTPISEAGFSAALARPKSRILAWPRLVTKMFAGLMSRWTMPSACAASSPSAMSMAMRSSCSNARGRPPIKWLRGAPSNDLHGYKGGTVFLADVVDGADVGMIERGGGPSFAAKTLQRLRITGDIIRKKFEGNKPA